MSRDKCFIQHAFQFAMMLAVTLHVISGRRAGAAQNAGGSYQTYQIVDRETGALLMDISLRVNRFPPGTLETLLRKLPHNVPGGFRGDCMTLAKYIYYLRTNDIRSLSQLYGKNGNMRQIVQVEKLLRDDFTRKSDVELLAAWHFGAFELMIVRIVSAGGGTHIKALGIVRSQGQYFRVDDWGRNAPVLALLYYLAGNLNEGIRYQGPNISFKRTMPIDSVGATDELSKAGSLTIKFNGNLYPFSEKWRRMDQTAEAAGKGAFFHAVCEASRHGTNAEFLGLWADKDKGQLEELLNSNPNQFQAVKNSYACNEETKDLMTMILGDYRVHYFVVKDKPAELRNISFETFGGELKLARLYYNVRVFLDSSLFRNQVFRLWQSQRGHASALKPNERLCLLSGSSRLNPVYSGLTGFWPGPEPAVRLSAADSYNRTERAY